MIKRDNSYYAVYYGIKQISGLTKNRLVLNVINLYVEKNPKVSAEELKRIFPKALQGTYGVIELARVAKTKRKSIYEKCYFYKEWISTSTEDIVVCTQWTLDKINGFIEVAHALGFKIDRYNY